MPTFLVLRSLFLALLQTLHERAVDNHLFGEARVDAFFLVHVQLFLVEGFHAVVETLGGGVEEKAGTGLEVDKFLVSRRVHFCLK